MRATFPILLVSALIGCGDGNVSGAPELTLVDSVRVTENDQLYVGRPNAIAAGPNGSVFISDAANNIVLRVSRDGKDVRTVATRGPGPGEVSAPASLTVIADSILAIKDLGTHKIDLFGLGSFSYRGSIPLRGPSGSMSSWAGALLLPSLSLDSSPVSGNRMAIVFYDPVMRNGVYAGDAFLQIVDWEKGSSCNEIPLPVPSDVPVRFAVREDTLISVVQHADSTTGASTWIKRWHIGAGGC